MTSVFENEDYKMLWGFSVRTDHEHEIEARGPDLLIIDKSEKSCQIIDVAIPKDGRVRAKEDEKVENIKTLREKFQRCGELWRVKTKVIPIVVGALETIPLRLKENLRTMGVNTFIELIQRSVLLESARILRKVVEMSREEESEMKDASWFSYTTGCFPEPMKTRFDL